MKITNTTLLFLILISAGCAEMATDGASGSGEGRLYGEEAGEGECPASCDEVFNVEKLEQEIDVATAEVPVEVEVNVCLQPVCSALAAQYEQTKVEMDAAKENLAAAKEQEAIQNLASGVTMKTGSEMRWVVYEYKCREGDEWVDLASNVDLNFDLLNYSTSSLSIGDDDDDISLNGEGDLAVSCDYGSCRNRCTYKVIFGYLN